MKKNQTSIKKRLLLLLMAGLCAISTIMFFEARSSAKTAANEAYDRALLGSALAILERVLIIGANIEVDIPYVALEMLTTDHQDRIYYQVKTQGGEFLTGYQDLPQNPTQDNTSDFEPLFFDGIYRKGNVRIASVQKYISSPLLSTRVIVKVAETTQARDALIDKMVQEALVRQFILISVAALIMWLGISWGLKPLERLQQALNRRNPNDLHSIQHDVPVEVQSLVTSINNLMDRLSESLASMRRFTSNAAHQLRTPIAAIQTQTELAIKTQDRAELLKRFAHLKQSTQQSTRMINQLLSLARITPDKRSLDFQRVDLNKICHDITRQLVPRAMENNIDLGFQDHDAQIQILGQEELLKEALKNLIENAITYCPKGSEITVCVSKQNERASIDVQDNGPGIKPDVQATIFERFDRGGRSDGDGCGLGLSIVKEIVERHSGSITLESQLDQGAKFHLDFPQPS